MRARPLAAEWLRSRRTFTWGAVLVTMVFTAQTLMMSRGALAEGAMPKVLWHGNALGWMHLYAVGFAVPLGLLSGVMAQWREDRWRHGGTAWRAVNPRRVLAARLLVLGVSALACQVGLIGPVVIDALVAGHGWGPWRSYLVFGLFMSLVVTGASAWGMALYRPLRVAAVGVGPALGLVWSVAGAVHAERADWWLLPWTWTARAPLTLLGVHGNSTLLEPGSPVWRYPLWPGFALVAVWGGVGALLVLAPRALLVRTPRGARAGSSAGTSSPAARAGVPRAVARAMPVTAPEERALAEPASGRSALAEPASGRPAPARRDGLRNSVVAVAGVLPWGLWAGLTLPLWGLLALVQMAYPGTDYAQTLFELMGAPVPAAVVAVSAWGRLQPGWRALLPRRPALALLGAVTLLSGAFLLPVLLVAWAISSVGAPSPWPYVPVLVTPAVTLMVFAASLAVALLTRMAVAIAGNVLLLLGGLVIGGNEVLGGLWPTAPWGWLRVAHLHPGLWPAVFLLATALAAICLGVAATRGKAVALRE